jgi:hypothetical protein
LHSMTVAVADGARSGMAIREASTQDKAATRLEDVEFTQPLPTRHG